MLDLESDCPDKIQVYLKSEQQKKLFLRILRAIGQGPSDTIIYLMTKYADEHNLITEALHQK